ncbi:hypothetical protein CHS0354_035290 [Potamilus streckersoni]|uniref:BPL/LPL catalytic domain-containing protein n=1 Tax=Potamilus streckersoni TaxID=2493646 RepID=A0AAE0S327_9BIVA|nr:hypothetical protein CHS0354_035290 [Potamilus streckersoni]
MEEGKTTDETSVCFREISGYEVTVGGKKLIGSAQHRNSRSILQHGSILLDVRYDVWVNIWRGLVSEEQLRARIPPLQIFRTQTTVLRAAEALKLTDIVFKGKHISDIEKT